MDSSRKIINELMQTIWYRIYTVDGKFLPSPRRQRRIVTKWKSEQATKEGKEKGGGDKWIGRGKANGSMGDRQLLVGWLVAGKCTFYAANHLSHSKHHLQYFLPTKIILLSSSNYSFFISSIFHHILWEQFLKKSQIYQFKFSKFFSNF